MRRWFVRLGVLVCVVLVLIAGVVVGQRNGLICFSEGSGGPPTTTTGPVTEGVRRTPRRVNGRGAADGRGGSPQSWPLSESA